MDALLNLKYFILGLVQGFTEPIPVSSSGHLVLVQELFGVAAEGISFEAFVNFASLLVVLFIYRKDIVSLACNGWKYLTKKEKACFPEFKMIICLIIATIPAAIGGVLFEDVIGTIFKSPKMIGISLLITAVALWIVRNMRGRKGDFDISYMDALIIGLAQAVALIPGISRSGATIVAALLLGTSSSTALRFSFLMYIPVSLGGMILSGSDIITDPQIASLAMPYALAFVAALVMNYISLKWFMNIMEKGNLKYFSFYCVIVGILAIAVL